MPDWAFALAISGLAATIFLLGIRVSARYTKAMAILESMILIGLSLDFLSASHRRLYSPVTTISSPLLAAALLGLGIPTGYGPIAPLGKDARSANIGKAAVAVVFYGGILATIFLYSLGVLEFTGNLMEFLITEHGLIGRVLISFAAMNDGALGGVAYMLALSRTLEAMAEDNYMPSAFSRRLRGEAAAGRGKAERIRKSRAPRGAARLKSCRSQDILH